MPCWKSTRCTFAVDPAFAGESATAVGQEFFAGDVVADEIDKGAFQAGNDFLERFENERVDQEVIDGGKICTEGHVVEIGVGFLRAERRIDKLFVLARQRN